MRDPVSQAFLVWDDLDLRYWSGFLWNVPRLRSGVLLQLARRDVFFVGGKAQRLSTILIASWYILSLTVFITVDVNLVHLL